MGKGKDSVTYEHIPITGIKRHKDKLAVYNMSVDEDMTYTANGFVVHNCAALHGTVIADMDGKFDAYQTFDREKRADGSPSLKFYGDQTIPPRHPRCRCAIVSWRDAWRQGALFSPEQMVKDGKDWAENHGYTPKSFAPNDLSAAQARINDVKDYLANTKLEDLDTKILAGWLDELKGISAASDLEKGTKISASKLATQVQQVMDLVGYRDKGMNFLGQMDAMAISNLIDQVGAMSFSGISETRRKDLLALLGMWVEKADQDILDTWDMAKFLAPSYKSGVDFVGLVGQGNDIAKFLANPDSSSLSPGKYKAISDKLADLKAYMGDWIESTTKLAMEQNDPSLVGPILKMLKGNVSTLEGHKTFEDLLVYGMDRVNVVEDHLKALNVMAKYDSLTSAQLTNELKALGVSPTELKYLTKEQKVTVLKQGVDNPESKAWFAESKKKNVEAVKASQAKKKAQTKAVKEAVTVEREALDDIAPEPLIANVIPGVYQDLDWKPQVESFTPSPKVVLKRTNGQEIPFTYVGDAKAKFGGQSEKYLLRDPEGNDWLFKVYGGVNDTGWAGHGEVAANDIMDALGHSAVDVRYVEFNIPGRGTRAGSVQRIIPKAGDTENVLPSALTDAQRKQLQEFQVVDYLLENLDCHQGNFAIMHDGSLMAWDKGQSFKHWDQVGKGGGRDPETILSLLDHNAYSQPYYSEMWKGYIQGKFDMDLDGISDFIEKVENLPDQVFVQALKPYVDGRFRGDAAGRAQFMAQVLDRKHNIRVKVDEFYREVASKRGIAFKGLPPRKAIEEALAQDAKQGISRTVTAQFADTVQVSEFQGVTYFVGGESVENNAILVSQNWRRTASGIEPHLRLTLKLRDTGADVNLADMLAKRAGTSVPSVAPKALRTKFDMDNDIWDKVLGGLKTVQHHNTLGDYAYNQSKIDGMMEAKQKLLAEGMKLLSGPHADEDTQAVTHYLSIIQQVEEVMKTQQPLPPGTKFEPFTFMPPEPVKAKAVAPDPLDITNLSVTKISRPYALQEKHPDTGRAITLLLDHEQDFRKGTQFNFTLDKKYQVRFVPNRMGGQVGDAFKEGANELRSRMGSVELEVPWSGKSEEIEEALQGLRKLGLDITPATKKDLELSYWRQYTGTVHDSGLMGTNGSLADARIKGIYERMESELAAVVDPDQEIAIRKKAIASMFGQDAVDRADWRPKFSILGNASREGKLGGRPYWERSDLTPDILYENMPDHFGLVHALNLSDEGFEDAVRHTGYMYATEERTRLGMDIIGYAPDGVKSAGGASSLADMGTGGADYFFTRMGLDSAGGLGESRERNYLVLSPKLMNRMSTITYDSDYYGKPTIRQTSRYFNPKTWQQAAQSSDNETIIKYGINLLNEGEWELYFTRTNNARQSIIEAFHEAGVTEIRGIPIEERVVSTEFARSRGLSRKQYAVKFFKDHRKEIFE